MSRPSARPAIAATVLSSLSAGRGGRGGPCGLPGFPLRWRDPPPPPTTRPAPASAVTNVLSSDGTAPCSAISSAFYVSVPGRTPLAVAARHAVAAGPSLVKVIPADDSRRGAAVVAEDPVAGRAALDVEGEPPAVLALSFREPSVGERLRVASRLGVTEATSEGMARDDKLGRAPMLSAPGLGPGAGGGAVVYAGGSVVGVVWGATNDERHGGAIPAARAAERLARAGRR